MRSLLTLQVSDISHMLSTRLFRTKQIPSEYPRGDCCQRAILFPNGRAKVRHVVCRPVILATTKLQKEFGCALSIWHCPSQVSCGILSERCSMMEGIRLDWVMPSLSHLKETTFYTVWYIYNLQVSIDWYTHIRLYAKNKDNLTNRHTLSCITASCILRLWKQNISGSLEAWNYLMSIETWFWKNQEIENKFKK